MPARTETPQFAPAAVTFDIGGTLLFPHPCVGDVYAEVLAEYGVGADPRALDAGFRRAWKDVVAETGGSTDEIQEIRKWKKVVRKTVGDCVPGDRFDPVFESLWNTFAEARRWRVRENTQKVLTLIRDRGIRTAVLSNWDSRLRLLLDELELSGLFDAVFISSEVGWEKPDQRLFREAERRLDLAPTRILHVGDRAREDVEAARAAGWQAVWIREEGGTREGDIPVITDLRQLPDRLGSGESD